MIKNNKYKLNNKIFFFIVFLIFISVYIIIYSIDLKKIIINEIEGFQKNFVSFSSIIQLFDNGDIQQSEDIKISDILPASKQFLSVLTQDLFKNKNNNLSEINLFIRFKDLNKIYEDRRTAIALGYNHNPRFVPCKISDGTSIFKCKVRLKGHLQDHWDAKVRFSLRVKVVDGYIYGLQNFSIQKPRSRQFPYDLTFAYLINKLGLLSNHKQEFYNIKINNDNWGVMNVEPTIDNKFIEVRDLKRFGIFKISNEENWIYKFQNQELVKNHFISDPTVFFSQKGSKKEILKNKNAREIYSYIFYSLNSKNTNIFDRSKLIDSFVFSLIWGDLHPLLNSNSVYTWNAYNQKLEPILNDQNLWFNIEERIKNIEKLPYIYSLIFKNIPITKNEFLFSINKFSYYLEHNDHLDILNNFRTKYFPNDRNKSITKLIDNIIFLQKNVDSIVKWINNTSNNYNKNSIKSDYKFDENFNNKFLKIIHFTNGEIKIFNLTSQPVEVSEILFDNERVYVNKIIKASKKYHINNININTNAVGIYDKKIKVIGKFKNIKKEFYNEYSLYTKSYFENFDYYPNNHLCEFYDSNLCIISGEFNVSKSIVFDKNTIIKEGTSIKLLNNSDLFFNSTVKMEGLINKNINFSGSGSVNIINKLEEETKLEFVNFIDLISPSTPMMRFSGSVNIYGGNVIIKNVKFANGNTEDQLNIVHSKILVSDTEFKNAKSDSLDCDFCEGKISNTIFDKSGGDAIDISGSNLKISKIKTKSTKDKAISIGENSIVELLDINIEDTGIAVAVKDGSKVKINNIFISNIIHNAFMTYVKKNFYLGETKLIVHDFKSNNKIENNLCVRQEDTFATINDNECLEKFIDVDALYNN